MVGTSQFDGLTLNTAWNLIFTSENIAQAIQNAMQQRQVGHLKKEMRAISTTAWLNNSRRRRLQQQTHINYEMSIKDLLESSHRRMSQMVLIVY